MAISVDTTIARWGGVAGGASASFIPANNSLIVLCLNMDSNGAPQLGSVTGGGLTWTRQAIPGTTSGGSCEIWTAPVTTGASMQITISEAHGFFMCAAKAYLVQGHDLASSIGAAAMSATNTGANPVDATLTATVAGRLFGAYTDWNAAGIPTGTVIEGAQYPGAISGGSGYRNADHTSSAGSIAVSFTAPSGPDASWCALEIKADAGGGGGSTSFMENASIRNLRHNPVFRM